MRKILIAVSVLLSFTVIVLAQSTQKKDSLHIYLNEVTVSSLRANEKSAVTYSDVSSEEIEKQNGGRDIPYLLSLTPSFVTTSDAGTGIGYTNYSIRGTDANRINVTINGVPLNDSNLILCSLSIHPICFFSFICANSAWCRHFYKWCCCFWCKYKYADRKVKSKCIC